MSSCYTICRSPEYASVGGLRYPDTVDLDIPADSSQIETQTVVVYVIQHLMAWCETLSLCSEAFGRLNSDLRLGLIGLAEVLFLCEHSSALGLFLQGNNVLSLVAS